MSTAHQPSSWRKSTRSQNTSHCVEVGRLPGGAAVRDSKDRAAGHLTADHHQWRAFLAALKADRLG